MNAILEDQDAMNEVLRVSSYFRNNKKTMCSKQGILAHT